MFASMKIVLACYRLGLAALSSIYECESTEDKGDKGGIIQVEKKSALCVNTTTAGMR